MTEGPYFVGHTVAETATLTITVDEKAAAKIRYMLAGWPFDWDPPVAGYSGGIYHYLYFSDED